MHMSVHVTTTGPHHDQPELAAHGLAVVVATGDDGKAVPVRQWIPDSEEDRSLDAHAQHLIALRTLAEPFTIAGTLPTDPIR